MAPGSRHSMDGVIDAGDVVVSRVNGTRDLYLVATVASAVEDLALCDISTAHGHDAAVRRGHEQRNTDRRVWLFAGSAAAYVKASAPEK